MGTSEKIRNLEKKLKEASSGDPIRIEKQHNAGKMTARERILTLLDSDVMTYQPQDMMIHKEAYPVCDPLESKLLSCFGG